MPSLDSMFSSPAMLRVFDAQARLQGMLDFEAALARAEAEVGIVPAAVAAEIAGACDAADFDLVALEEAARMAGNPAIPMVAALQERLSDEGRRVVHLGATSQDAMDTGVVLQMRAGLAVLDEQLAAVAQACADHAERHRGTVMAGRTLMQQAVPVTFGLKAAQWLTAALDRRDRLQELVLPVQLGGAVGTLAALGEHGLAVRAALARQLDLAERDLPWHTRRDGLAEIAAAVVIAAGAAATIARDIVLLMQTEVGEAAEGGAGGSSTMPHKRNPVACLQAVAAARQAQAQLPVLLELAHEHERAAGAWHAEWTAVPLLFCTASGAIARTGDAVAGLTVDPARMAANLGLTHGLMLSEALVTALAPALGRAEAKTLAEAACRTAVEQGRTLREVLGDAAYRKAVLGLDLDRVCDPAAYLGATDALIDAALTRYHGA